MTNTIVAWLPVFAYPDYVNIVLDSWRFLQRERGIVILAWVILENHLHWIATGPDLSKRVGECKSFTAKQIIRKMEAKGGKDASLGVGILQAASQGGSDTSGLAGRQSPKGH